MTEPRHRRPRRRKGLAVRSSEGRRRRSGVIDEAPRTIRELSRQARRSTASRARRRILLAVLGAVAIVATSVVLSWLTLRESGAPDLTVDPPTASGSSVLLVVTDDDNLAASIALVVAHPTEGSRLVLFPPSLLTILPGFGESELADVIRFNGEGLAETTVANLLGVRIDAVAHLTGPAFASAVDETLTVELANPLLVPEQDGFSVLAAEGPAEREPAMLVTLLTTQGDDHQLEWLDRQGSVWRAVMEAAADRQDIAQRLTQGAAGDTTAALQALVAASQDPELVITAVPVSRIEATGGDTERYQLSGSAADAFVTDRFLYLRLREEPRPRVEVLNGNGRIGTTAPIAAVLVDAGFRIVKTDNADRPDYEVTQVIAQGRGNQNAALEVQSLLGNGEVLLELRQPSGVVDITIIVGRDIPA